jgi:hypothetical protein
MMHEGSLTEVGSRWVAKGAISVGWDDAPESNNDIRVLAAYTCFDKMIGLACLLPSSR